jgi:hypothetical protein
VEEHFDVSPYDAGVKSQSSFPLHLEPKAASEDIIIIFRKKRNEKESGNKRRN